MNRTYWLVDAPKGRATAAALAVALLALPLAAGCSGGGAPPRRPAVTAPLPPGSDAPGTACPLASLRAGSAPSAECRVPSAESRVLPEFAGEDSALVAAYFAQQVAEKRAVDAIFERRLGGEMVVRKIAYPAADGLTIPAYLFAPSDTTAARRRPVVLFAHGGVHGDFGLVHLQQVRSLVGEGYVVVAPEYRGSTGYGARFYGLIDYGGLEVEDVVAAREYLGAQVPSADTGRVAVMGYSHGGFIALHAVMRYPERFRVAVAHVPVADLPTRMRTHPAWYQAIFAAQPGFGATLDEDSRPYVARSPSAHARALRTPVLVHAADNDDDVFIAENRILRDSMVAAGKDRAGLYTYREFNAPPGGHSFGVLDTPVGREHWAETLAFLRKHLR